MTPIANPQNDAEFLYNESQIRSRGKIERTFGIWKRRFSCLSTGLRCNIPLVQDVIVATAVLHNIARIYATNEDDEFFEGNDAAVVPEIEEHEPHNGPNNNLYRAEFLNYFRNL